MKKRLLAGMIAGAFVLCGCSGLSEDNSLNARTHRYLDQHSEEMKRLSEEQKKMSEMIAAVTIEPAKQYPSKFERQIVAEFYNSIMNECGYGNKFGCNLDEIVKDPYKGRKAYIPHNYHDIIYYGVTDITVLSDYIPNKSVVFSEYKRMDAAQGEFKRYYESLKESKDYIEDYIVSNGNKYVRMLIEKKDLTHIHPSADLSKF